MNVSYRLLHWLGLAGFLAVTTTLCAQTAAPRIRGPIEPTPSVRLRGSLNPHIRSAEDLGPMASDTQIRGITLVFSRSAEQQSALDQLLADQTNPSSPLFHHWLTPAEFATRFGPAPADVAATQAWLQSRGFTIDPSPATADRITFSGSAAQIQQAFGAELHRFRSPATEGHTAELHFAPATDLSLPAALAPVTAAVLHLSDFRPKPNVRPHPDYTTVSTQSHFLTAYDILNMYDLGSLGGHNYASSQALAIVGQSYVPGGDSVMVRFASANSTGMALTPILVPNSGPEAIFPGDEGESEIDIEYSSAIAEGAHLFFVFTGASNNYGVNDAIAYAITHDIAPVISISYSECEPLLSASEAQQFNSLFQQAAAQGQTVVAASGDQGPTACAYYGSSSGLTTAQLQEMAVNFPASSPFVTAVGGTQMAPGTFSAGASPYWDTATIYDKFGSLTGYAPEVVWNEDSTTNGIFSSTGGTSIFFPRPSWQTGVPGIPSGSFRLVPDIAFQASTANPGYVICTDDPALGGDSSDCADALKLADSNGTYILAGGTSFSAPIFAGFVALLNGYQQSTGQGNVNPVLYGLAAQPAVYASAFHDITIGTSACVSGDGNCSTPGESGFAAGLGYDQATGLGSLDFANLVAAWPASPSKSLIPTYIFGSGAPQTANPGDPIPLNVQIGESSLIGAPGPTGSVLLNVDGGAEVSVPLTTSGGNASATYTFNAPSAPGSHTVSLIYPGDATHSGSTNAISFAIGSLEPTGSITLSTQNLSLAANGSGSTPITITPSGGYNGNLTWTVSVTGTVETTYCYLINAPIINASPVTATLHFGVAAACDTPGALVSRSTTQRAALDPHGIPGKPVGGTVAERLTAAPLVALLAFTFLPRRRRKPLPFLTTLIVLGLPLALSGCGGSASSGGGGGGGGGGNSQTATYTVTLNAQDSVNTAITGTTSFTLTVN